MRFSGGGMIGLTSRGGPDCKEGRKKGKKGMGCSLENKKGRNFEGLFKEA